MSNPNKVSVTKDSRTKKDRLYGHIQTLFQLQNLSEEYLNTLRYMVLMPEKGVSKSIFHKWLNSGDCNNINDLVEYGWVQEDKERNVIALHLMIHEVVKAFQQPNFRNCAPILTGIFTDCFWYGIDLPYYREVLNTIESIYENIEIDDVKSATLFMESTMNYLDKYGNISVIERVLEVMKETIPMGRQYRRETALYYSYLGGVALQKFDWESAVNAFHQGIIFAEPVNQEYAELASNLYCNLGTAYLGKKNIRDGRKYQKKRNRYT